jgi:hypothetical protein
MAYTPDYTPSDMPNVATDVLGEGGIQFKVWIPLLILGMILLVLAGAWAKIKSAGRGGFVR